VVEIRWTERKTPKNSQYKLSHTYFKLETVELTHDVQVAFPKHANAGRQVELMQPAAQTNSENNLTSDRKISPEI